MEKRDDVCVVYDLDGTLISREQALMKQVNILGMPAGAIGDQKRIYETYLIPAIAGLLPPELEPLWIAEEIENYVRHRLDAEAWRSALQSVRFRPGAVETIRGLHALGVPQAIVSYGVADFIDHVLDAHGVYGLVDRVYAARLVHDDDQVVVGYHGQTVVHPGNKGDWSKRFADEFRVPHERIVGVGDSRGDRTLGCLQAMRIGIAESEAQADEIREVMSQVVVTTEFFPIWELILLKAGLSKP